MLSNQVLSLIGIILLGINVLLYFISFAKLNKTYKIFQSYLVVILFIQIITYYKARNGINNLHFSHYYFIIQFIIISIYYSSLINTLFFKKINYLVLLVIILFLIIQYSIYPELYNSLNVLEIIMTTLPLILYSLYYFFKGMLYVNKVKYLNFGLFIYLISSFLVFVSGDYIMRFEKEMSLITWKINSIIYVFFQLLIFYEWHKNIRYKKFRNKLNNG